jgi:molybdopterin/thiamine biosynthesis adenylyltransferase
MEERHSRNIPALTKEECALLRRKRVLVVGCGGLGGHIIEMLTRVGTGFLRVVDGDIFEPSNLTVRTDVLGRPKAVAALERIARIDPDTEAKAVTAFMTEENIRELVRDCDIVMDALDSISARRILARACSNAGIPYVYGAIQGWVAQAAVSTPRDGLIGKLFPEEVEIRD